MDEQVSGAAPQPAAGIPPQPPRKMLGHWVALGLAILFIVLLAKYHPPKPLNPKNPNQPSGETGGGTPNVRPNFTPSEEAPTSDASTQGCIAKQYNDGFRIQVTDPTGACSHMIGMQTTTDSRITLNAKLLGGANDHGYGLAFAGANRGGPQNSFYAFMVTSNGGYKLIYWDGQEFNDMFPWGEDPAVRQGYGVVNEVAVTTVGNTIYCFVNGKYVGGYQSPITPTGGVGFFVEKPGMSAQFLDTKLYTDVAAPEGVSRPGAVLFSDDLLSGKSIGAMSGPHCTGSYDSEGYVVQNIHATDPCRLQITQAGQLSEHVKVDLWIKLRSGSNNHGYGLVFAQQPNDSDQVFAFMVDTLGSFQLSQYTTSWRNFIKWSPDSNIHQGYNVWNRLSAEIRGQGIELYVNGQHVGWAVGYDLVKGYVGCYLDMPGMVAVIRNLTITQL